jgi:hypothetical protein
LIACLAGGFLGVAVASPINSSLELNPTLAVIACAGVGIVLGYVVSTLFDVFTASSGNKKAEY